MQFDTRMHSLPNLVVLNQEKSRTGFCWLYFDSAFSDKQEWKVKRNQECESPFSLVLSIRKRHGEYYWELRKSSRSRLEKSLNLPAIHHNFSVPNPWICIIIIQIQSPQLCFWNWTFIIIYAACLSSTSTRKVDELTGRNETIERLASTSDACSTSGAAISAMEERRGSRYQRAVHPEHLLVLVHGINAG